MALWKYDRSKRRTSMKRRGARTTRRRVGAFGLYRSTRNIAAVRRAARNYARPRRLALTPFPNSKLVRHKYCDYISIPAGGGAGVPVVYQFRANSTFDPDYTSTGHQPMFRDEMAAQYKFYTVLSSVIKVEIAGTNAQELVYALWCDDDTTINATNSEVMESHAHSLDRLDRRNSPKRLTGWYNAAKWNKTTRSAILGDDSHKTGAGVNPGASVQKFYTLYISPLNPANTITAMTAKVQIVYYTMWREPVDHAGS